MGDTLAVLIEEVQYELGQSASSAVGKNFREHIKGRINREYRRLYHDFAWPHLRITADVDLQAGDRYYDFPTGLSLNTTQEVWRRWGGRWEKIEREIPIEAYNVHDSDADARTEPVMLWQPYQRTQLEVWPIPSTNITGGLRFVGQTAYTRLVEEDDVCDLDTDLVVLHAAAELARKSDNDDAQMILARAVSHYNTLKDRSQKGSVKVDFTQGPRAPYRKGFGDKVIIGVDLG